MVSNKLRIVNIINLFESFYLKLPPFSEEAREFIAKILPVLSLVFGILITIASVLEILGTPFLSAFTIQGKLPVIQILLLTNALGIVQGILMIFSVQFLNRHELRGWKFLFYSQMIWAITSLISISPSFLISLVLFYPFFQVKKYYN